MSQEVRFTLQQDTDALYFQVRPILQDNNTLLRPRYVIIVRFYIGTKYVYTADIFILISRCYIFMLLGDVLYLRSVKMGSHKILPTLLLCYVSYTFYHFNWICSIELL